jgi:hypothetical protein
LKWRFTLCRHAASGPPVDVNRTRSCDGPLEKTKSRIATTVFCARYLAGLSRKYEGAARHRRQILLVRQDLHFLETDVNYEK